MSDYIGTIESLLMENRRRYSPTAIFALEEAVRIADLHQDLYWGMCAREALVDGGIHGGFPEKSLVAFSWMLAQMDKNPELKERFDLSWQFKWIAEQLPDFSHVSRQQVVDLLDDMSRRYQEDGLSQRAVESLRSRAGRQLGDEEMTRRHYERWKQLPKDGSQDCAACERDFEIKHYLFFGELEKAMTKAEPMVRGQLSCFSVPETTFSTLLLPLFQAGRLDEADRLQRKVQGKLLGNTSYFTKEIGMHLQYLAVTSQLARAVHLLENGWSGVQRTKPSAKWEFLLGVRFVCYCLRMKGRQTIQLRLEDSVPITHDGKHGYDLEALEKWCEDEVRGITEQFDARNGNEYYSHRLAAREVLLHNIQVMN
jgi:hypothetical protein